MMHYYVTWVWNFNSILKSIDANVGHPEQDARFGSTASVLATGRGRFPRATVGAVKSKTSSRDFDGFQILSNLFAVGGVSLAGLP